MNAKGIANTALAASALAETFRYTPRQTWRFPILSVLWAIHIVAVLLVARRSPRVPAPGLLGKLGGLLALAGGACALYSAVGEHTREGRGRSEGAEHYPPLSAVLALEEEAVGVVRSAAERRHVLGLAPPCAAGLRGVPGRAGADDAVAPPHGLRPALAGGGRGPGRAAGGAAATGLPLVRGLHSPHAHVRPHGGERAGREGGYAGAFRGRLSPCRDG